MKADKPSRIRRENLRELRETPTFKSIDRDVGKKNLPTTPSRYQRFLDDLYRTGWTRFAAGFKAALYGHPDHPWCIKLLGMGVGENPLYFCDGEHGYILEHERNMLTAFRQAEFHSCPNVLSRSDSIRFLIDDCKISKEEAETRCESNDVLILEYIPGIPLASWTGHSHLDCNPHLELFDQQLLGEAEKALYHLRGELRDANRRDLVHNDPVLPNILLILDRDDNVSARLVDYELAQNLTGTTPEQVASEVENLYRERAVPRNRETGRHVKNLDQHLLDGAIEAVHRIRGIVESLERRNSPLAGEPIILPNIPGLGGINLEFRELYKLYDLSDEEILIELVNEGEYQQVAFKSSVPTGAALERNVLGMSNTGGGTLLLGVRDDGKITGLTERELKRARNALSRLAEVYTDLQWRGQEIKTRGRTVFSVVVTPVQNVLEQRADLSGRLWRRRGTMVQQVPAFERSLAATDDASADFQADRSRFRLPFGALRASLLELRSHCAYPECEISDPLEVAAIDSLSPGGPRYKAEQSEQERTSLSNFLLLCPNHHVVVDRDPSTYDIKWLLRARARWIDSEPYQYEETSRPPTCFLSYAWEDNEHVQWVARLANDLQAKMGVAVLLDTWALRPGDSITQFMENAVEDSDFVAMVLTPSYARRVKTREGGVGYEGGIVTGSMLEGRSSRRSVPLLRGDPKQCTPAFLKGIMYIDFRREDRYDESLEELGRAIHDAPKAKPPPIGNPPWEG